MGKTDTRERETKIASVYQEKLFTWNTKVSLNCGWQPFRRALAWRCRRSSDGNSCSFTSVTLPWHRAGRLAARSRDTTSCSLSCWYRRANHRRTAEPWGRVHSLGSSGSWYRSGLMLPRGTQPQEPHRAEWESQNILFILPLYHCFWCLMPVLQSWHTPDCQRASLGVQIWMEFPFLSMLCFFFPLF